MTDSKKNMSEEYDFKVAGALESAKHRQHLRYFGRLFLTKEVCVAGLIAQQCYSTPLSDLGCVPVGILEEVVVELRKRNKDNTRYLEKLEKEYTELKAREDYENDITKFKNLLEMHQVKTHNELCKKIYVSHKEKIYNSHEEKETTA